VITGSHRRDDVLGFTVALAFQDERYVFSLQTWADRSIQGSLILDKMFQTVMLWTKRMGRNELRCESTRSSRAMEKRWGWKEVTRVFQLSCNDTGKVLAKHEEKRERVRKKARETWVPSSIRELKPARL
jgi:hypothetical protein